MAATEVLIRVVAVAATARYEAYPSIAYDPAGRLWVAYEEGAERWGKDYGAYSSPGIALYQGRAVRLRGFESDRASRTESWLRAGVTLISTGLVVAVSPFALTVNGGITIVPARMA